MLNKFVIHFKNVIFFKVIIFALIIVFLIILVPISQEDLIKSSARKEKSKLFLKQAILKLNSITSLDEKLIETNVRYQYLKRHPNQDGCKEKIILLQIINKIFAGFAVSKPSIRITRFYNESNQKFKSTKIVMRDYQLDIAFNVKDENTLINISRNIERALPQGSVILSMNVRRKQSLTPMMIAQLAKNKELGFLAAEIKIKLREAVYEQ